MEERILWWLAGLLEGEGTFRFQYEQGKYAALTVSMSSRDQDVIRRVHSLAGGRTHVTDLTGRPFHHWTLCGLAARDLMIALYPLLGERRQNQVATAIYRWWEVPAGNKFKTHCKNGHEFTPANTIRNPCDEGRRRCRICTSESQKRAEAVRRMRRVGQYA